MPVTDISQRRKFLNQGNVYLPHIAVIEKVVGLPKASVMTAKDPIEQVTKTDIYKASEETTSEEEDDDLPF